VASCSQSNYIVTDVTKATIGGIKSKFHYAILVAHRSEAGRRPAASWEFGLSRTILLASSKLAGLRQVCDQPWTCLRFAADLSQIPLRYPGRTSGRRPVAS